MYLPRSLISHLYLHLLRTHHPLSPSVLILVALEPDALCACKILTALLKRDFIAHKIQPVSGYGDLSRVGTKVVQPMRTTEGGAGGIVVCLGVGGAVDLPELLGLHTEEQETNSFGGVELWLMDARRPWNLSNVFGSHVISSKAVAEGHSTTISAEGIVDGEIKRHYKPGQGGVVVFDDGDIEEELVAEREAYCALAQMPDIDDDGEDLDDSIASSEDERETTKTQSRKRKSWSDGEDGDSESDEDESRPRQRRRSNSSSSITISPQRPQRRGLFINGDIARSDSPSTERSSTLDDAMENQLPKETSPRSLRRQLLRLRRKHTQVLDAYYDLGTSYSEPISSLMYSLASELGREDNDLLWQAIVGVTSLELYGRSMTGVGVDYGDSSRTDARGWSGTRGSRIRQLLRDEVRRLNPPELADISRDINRGDAGSVIPTTARSPTDKAIRLSPEPLFLLIRHWSLYDSMLHSPYLSARLHIWSDNGRKRLHKLLAKMGVSLTQCKQTYTHMDMDLKRSLRSKLLTFAPMYGLEGVVPPDVSNSRGREGWGFVRSWGWKACLSASDVAVVTGAILEVGKSGMAKLDSTSLQSNDRSSLTDESGMLESEEWTSRFFEAYDALENIDALKSSLKVAMELHRAILRTGTSLLAKRQLKHLHAFRMALVRDDHGPDAHLFVHPSALTKLALWLAAAVAEQEKDAKGKMPNRGRGTPLVAAALNERRGVYVVVGIGGGGGVDAINGIEDRAEREKRRKEKEQRRRAKEEKKAEKEKRRQQRAEERNGEDDADDEEEEEEAESSESDDSEDDEASVKNKRGYGRNRFGNAFQEVIDETNARVKVDSFEHCVVEVQKEDLASFLESLSMKAVVG